MKNRRLDKVVLNTYQDSLFRYLNEVAKIPRIYMEEEILLGEKIRGGDKDAAYKLARGNLLFVVHVAKDYQGRGVPLADLVNEGNEILFKMAERFDETRGFKFTSFASSWVKAAILKTIYDRKGITHIPVNKIGLLYRISRASQKFEAENGLPPSVEELASLLQVSEKNVIETIIVSSHYSSLDASLVGAENLTLYDVLQSEDFYDPDKRLLYESICYEAEIYLNDSTNKRNADILRMHFGIGCEPMTNLEISARMGLSEDRVRHLRHEAVNRLRQKFSKETNKVH